MPAVNPKNQDNEQPPFDAQAKYKAVTKLIAKLEAGRRPKDTKPPSKS